MQMPKKTRFEGTPEATGIQTSTARRLKERTEKHVIHLMYAVNKNSYNMMSSMYLHTAKADMTLPLCDLTVSHVTHHGTEPV